MEEETRRRAQRENNFQDAEEVTKLYSLDLLPPSPPPLIRRRQNNPSPQVQQTTTACNCIPASTQRPELPGAYPHSGPRHSPLFAAAFLACLASDSCQKPPFPEN